MTGKDMLLAMSDLDEALIRRADQNYEMLQAKKGKIKWIVWPDKNICEALVAFVLPLIYGMCRGYIYEDFGYSCAIISFGCVLALMFWYCEKINVVKIAVVCIVLKGVSAAKLYVYSFYDSFDRNNMLDDFFKGYFILGYSITLLVIALVHKHIKKKRLL